MRAYHHEMEILQTFLPHFEKNVFAYANHYVSGAADYFDGIEPLPEEYQMVKRRYSGFFGTDLEILLKGLGIEHLARPIVQLNDNSCIDLSTRLDLHIQSIL